jgi:hypothetical protein
MTARIFMFYCITCVQVTINPGEFVHILSRYRVFSGFGSQRYTNLYIDSRSSSVSIESRYELDDLTIGVRVPLGSRIVSSPYRPNRLWGPHSLLSNWQLRFFRRRKSGRDVKLTTQLQLVPRARKHGSIVPLPHTFSWRSA